MIWSGSTPALANGPRMWRAVADAGRRIVELVAEDLRPRRILTAGAFRNAVIAMLAAIAVFFGFRAGAFSFVSRFKWIFILSAGLLLGVLALLVSLGKRMPREKPAGGKARFVLRKEYALYYLLVIMVLLWGLDPVKAALNCVNLVWEWPGLHNLVQRMEPLVAKPSPYPAVYTLNWLSASGSACMIASLPAW